VGDKLLGKENKGDQCNGDLYMLKKQENDGNVTVERLHDKKKFTVTIMNLKEEFLLGYAITIHKS